MKKNSMKSDCVYVVADLNTVRFSAYRTSMKLRLLQKALHRKLIVQIYLEVKL